MTQAQQRCRKKLVLEDGTAYFGYGFGAKDVRVTEVVFNTSAVGYQELISDPSYTDQAVVMAYPLIGNYGINPDDYETQTPTISGLIVREYNNIPSNFRATETLGAVMERYHITGLSGIDTRKLIRSIRDYGTRYGIITDADMPQEVCMALLQSYCPATDAVARVSRKAMIAYPVEHPKFHVVAVDCGMKQNIVRCLNERHCSVTVVPWNTDVETVRKLHPDGILLSNGPGDPTNVPEVIKLVKTLRGEIPMFGICLGHQVLCLAYGAKTYKLKFGHRGGNHPVKNLKTDKIEITSQNHSYAVDAESLKDTALTMTHLNLLDQTVEGVECVPERAFSVQYHPESAPGPQDSGALFDQFLEWMEGAEHA